MADAGMHICLNLYLVLCSSISILSSTLPIQIHFLSLCWCQAEQTTWTTSLAQNKQQTQERRRHTALSCVCCFALRKVVMDSHQLAHHRIVLNKTLSSSSLFFFKISLALIFPAQLLKVFILTRTTLKCIILCLTRPACRLSHVPLCKGAEGVRFRVDVATVTYRTLCSQVLQE